MFHKMPILLLAIIFCIFLFGEAIPVPLKSFIYALSLTVKSAIIFALPFIIFMLLFKTVSQLSKDATKLVLLILAFVCCSNFLSTMISYQIGSEIYNMNLSIAVPQDSLGLVPSFNLALPKLVGNDVAMFGGILLGLFLSYALPDVTSRLSNIFDKVVSILLRSLTYVVPFFIAGFIVKLHHDKLMENILKDYSVIFTLVAISVISYIGFIYLACSNFQPASFFGRLKNMLPAAIAGFSSMSSAAAMPLTIIGTEKNTQNPLLSRLCIPATVNVHLIGDCFAIPIFAFAVMKNFGAPEPLFASYLLFAIYFVLAKFSVAAVPGGGILVMLPILESQLGFTAEMASLITALYILFDPVITCANVCGNGAFALALDRLQKLFFKPVTTQSK